MFEKLELISSGPRYFDFTPRYAACDFGYCALDPRRSGSQDCIFLECSSILGWILY